MSHTIIVVAGPTASGKSALSVSLARTLGGEIVNCDSVQMYRDLYIGSARITEKEMEGVPHHLLGIISPAESFDVGKFIKRAEIVINEIVSRGNIPIVVGGTALYIASLLYGLVDLPSSDPVLRAKLELESTEILFGQLLENDPESARTVHPNDRVRIIRALEACLLSEGPIAVAKRIHGQEAVRYNALVVVPLWTRAELYQRINLRAEKMIEDGLLEETKMLRTQYGSGAPALKTIGYDEAAQHLEGRLTQEEIAPLIAMHTRRFAKRQMTWLRNEPVKRGWKVRPVEGDPQLVLDGDTSGFTKPLRLKHFSVLDLDFKSLVIELKDRLNQGVSGVEAWFVPGAKVI